MRDFTAICSVRARTHKSHKLTHTEKRMYDYILFFRDKEY